MSVVDRIKEFIDFKKINITAFERSVGMSNASFGKSLRNKGAIGSDKIEKILEIYPEIDAEWLLTGKGNMTKTVPAKLSPHFVPSEERTVPPIVHDKPNWSDPKWNAEFSAIDTPLTLKEIAVEHIPTNMLKGRAEAYKPIPFVGEAAVAGFGNADFAIKERDVKDYYVIPKFKDSNIDFMIEIHGESMYPTFKSGDVVACTIIRESTFIQWNRVHLVATAEQGILIKRLKKGITGTTIMLVSDNPDYDPFEVELTSVKGIALVQGLVRLE